MSGDHAEFMAFARRILRAASRRMSDADPEDLADLVALRATVDEAIDTAARAVHAGGASWTQIGDALGITRQAARQKWHIPPSDKAELSADVASDLP